MELKFKVGDKVRRRDKMEDIGFVHSIEFLGEEPYYGIAIQEKIMYVSEEELMPYIGQNSVKDNLLGNYFGYYHDFQKALTFLKISNSSSIQNNIYAMNTSKTVFYEYQYKPLIKFINSYRRRILICDEVGLGKTIEAGLIMKELDARGELDNALKMRNRFGEDYFALSNREFCGILDGNKSLLEKYRKQRFIVSIEAIRSKKVEPYIERSTQEWSLLIVDEAHSLRNKNQQNRIIKALSARTQAMIFLTATPVHIAQSNLFNILNILDEQQYEDLHSFEQQLEENAPIVKALNAVSRTNPNLDIVLDLVQRVEFLYRENPIYKDILRIIYESRQNGITTDAIVEIQRNLSELHLIGPIYNRTLKKDVYLKRAKRIPHKISVTFSDEEQNLYEEILDKTRKYIELELDRGAAALSLCSAKQRLSSSLHAHRVNLEHKIELLYRSDENTEFIIFEEDEITHSNQLKLSDTNMADTKFLCLMQVLKDIQSYSSKTILFAFFKDTLFYLENMLTKKGVKTFILHGEVSMADRHQRIHNFKEEKDFCVLLSSRVGSEGIDLQFCDNIINFDLPWNPMELEQRIGRIDRIGQSSDQIHIYNFGMLSTIDDRIISRLYDRIELFEGTIGTLEPIMDNILNEWTNNIFFRDLTEKQAETILDEQERIIKYKLKTLQDLETASTELISLDQFFDQEIKSIQDNRRYISPHQLLQYIAGHIDKNYPESHIDYDSNSKIGKLKICRKFREDLHHKMQDSRDLNTFSYGQEVRFTFESEIAMKNDNTQLLNILHPLIKAITKQYDETKQIHNCHYFRINEKDLRDNEIVLDSGFYFYYIFIGKIESFRKISLIMPVILNQELKSIGDGGFSEKVIGVAVEKGKPSVQDIEVHDKNYLMNSYNEAFNLFKQRLSASYERHKARHEVVIEQRRSSKQLYWSNLIAQVKNRLDKAELESGDDRIITMYKGQLRNYEAKRSDELLAIEHCDKCKVEFTAPLYGGIFEVFGVE